MGQTKNNSEKGALIFGARVCVDVNYCQFCYFSIKFVSIYISLAMRQIDTQDETFTASFPPQNLNANASLHEIDVQRPQHATTNQF